MKIEVKIDDKEVKWLFDRLQYRVKNMEPVLKKIGMELRSEWELHWKKEEDPYGSKWAPLSDITKARRKGEEPYKILRDSGRLQRNFNVEATPDSVEIGTNIIYAATHQFGAKKGKFGRTKRGAPIPWGNIPQRRLLPDKGLPSSDWEMVRRKLEEFLF